VSGTEDGIDLGVAGAGARAEYERRRANREARVRAKYPRLGGLVLKLQEAPTHERAWLEGAEGEEMLARHLAKTCPDVPVLHDRRIPGTRANIDHIAIAPSGVFVIDAKRYKGKVEVRRSRRGGKELFIAGRRKTKLIEGLERQRALVAEALSETASHVPVHACLCFLNPRGRFSGTDIPVFRTLKVGDIPLYVPRRLSKRLREPGVVDEPWREYLAALLAQRFPST